MHGALAAYHDPSGEQRFTLGMPLDSVPRVGDPGRTKEEVIAGKVPALFRNSVLPVLAPGGEIWLILNGEGQLQRYRSNGTLELSVPLSGPERKQVWDEVVSAAKASRGDQGSVLALRYALDATVVGQTLWILLNTTEDGPAVLLAVAPNGQFKRRIIFPNVRGARFFALDHTRARVFFATSAASIVSSSVPDSILVF